MANIREIAKRNRLQKLREIFRQAKEKEVTIEKDKLVSKMIVEHCISRKTALEEINAVMDYAKE